MAVDDFVKHVNSSTGTGPTGYGCGGGPSYGWGSGGVELTGCGYGSGWCSGSGRNDGSGYGTGIDAVDSESGTSNGRGEGAGYGFRYCTGGKRTWL